MEGGQRFQLGQRCTRVDGTFGQSHSLSPAVRAAGRDQGRCRIRQHDFPLWPGRPLQHLPDNACVLFGRSAGQRLPGRTPQPEILRCDRVVAHHAITELADVGFRAQGDFVEPVQSVHDEGPLHAQLAQCAGQQLRGVSLEHAHYLHVRSGGVCQWPEKIEYRAQPQFAPRAHRVPHGRVDCGREQKPEAHLFDGRAGAFGGRLDRHAERLEHIGGAAVRADRTIAVLGHRHTGAGHHKRGCRRNVERPGCIPARATGVHQRLRRTSVGKDRQCMAAHRACESHQLIHRFAFDPQGHEQAGDLRVGGASAQDLFHHRFGGRWRQVLSGDNGFQSFREHRARPLLLRFPLQGKLLRFVRF